MHLFLSSNPDEFRTWMRTFDRIPPELSYIILSEHHMKMSTVILPYKMKLKLKMDFDEIHSNTVDWIHWYRACIHTYLRSFVIYIYLWILFETHWSKCSLFLCEKLLVIGMSWLFSSFLFLVHSIEIHKTLLFVPKSVRFRVLVIPM